MAQVKSLDELQALGARVSKPAPVPAPDPAIETAQALRALADAIERQSTGLAQSQDALVKAVKDAVKPVEGKPVEVRLPAVQEHRVTFEYDTSGRVVAATIKARRGD